MTAARGGRAAGADAESLVLHIHFRRAVHSISFRELGLVLGLYVLSPGALLVAQLVGAGTALTVVAKQRPSKVAATLARLAVTTGVAFLVFHAVVPRGGPFELVGLAGATLAAVTASLLAPLLASAAALAGSGELRLRRLPAATAIAVVAAITMSCLALIGLELARQDVRLIALLALPGAIGAVAVRSSVAYSRRREHIEYLYESMSAAHGAPEFSLAVGQLLIAVRRLLRAEHAEIFLFPAGADQGLRGTLGPYGEMTAYPDVVGAADEQVLAVLEAWSGAIVLPVPRPAHPLDGYLAARDLPDAIIAALPGEHGPFGLLVVGRRWSDEPDSFTDDDRRLLETFVGHASVLLENGRLERSLAQVTDLKDRLRHQAFHDVLTGLPNRALLTERVEAAVAGGGPPAAVLFLDLDDFKSVNDTLGHAVGDELLVEVARRVQGSVRPGDTAARLGGDEFAVLLEATDEQGAAVVADSLIESLSRPFVLAGRQSNLHASIGIAHAHSAGSAAELLHNADVAMYAAKASGKARFLHYEPTMHAELRRRHDFALELQGALERDEIAIVFEPIVDLRDQRIVAFEALARWNSPDRGVVQPDEFIAVAEEMGLMVQIGRRILRQACAAAATWQAAHPEHGPIGVSVNLGASEFADDQLVEEIARVLYDTRLPAESLMLEIAENDVMRSPDSALARLDELARSASGCSSTTSAPATRRSSGSTRSRSTPSRSRSRSSTGCSTHAPSRASSMHSSGSPTPWTCSASQRESSTSRRFRASSIGVVRWARATCSPPRCAPARSAACSGRSPVSRPEPRCPRAGQGHRRGTRPRSRDTSRRASVPFRRPIVKGSDPCFNDTARGRGPGAGAASRCAGEAALPGVFRRAPESLDRGQSALLLEAALAGACGRLRRLARAARPRRLCDLRDDPLGRERPVSKLRALVLGDRADDRAEPVEHAPALGVAQACRGLDVEERLDPGRALLRVLPAGTARPGEAEARPPTEYTRRPWRRFCSTSTVCCTSPASRSPALSMR